MILYITINTSFHVLYTETDYHAFWGFRFRCNRGFSALKGKFSIYGSKFLLFGKGNIFIVLEFLINRHLIYFLITFQVALCSHYFYNFRKKGPRYKWTIYKYILDNSKKCLSVGKVGILSVVVVRSLYRVYSLHQLM